MHKIYLSVIVGLVILSVFFYTLAGYRMDKIGQLEITLKQCETERKEIKNALALRNETETRTEATIGEIRTVIKTVKSPCDCYDSRIDDNIFKRVRGEK